MRTDFIKTVFIVQNSTGADVDVFASKSAAHKWMRGQGLHPIPPSRFWALTKDDLGTYDYWVTEHAVRT